MGIKIKNLQTGEFEKFNIPALKGEKGEPGEIEPSEKVDYIGKQHSKLRDTMNANVDYIIKTAIGKFNYLDYEGQHITATNSIEGHARSAILSGQTLVNLISINRVSITSSTSYEYPYNIVPTIGKKYLIKVKIKSVGESTNSLPVKIQPFDRGTAAGYFNITSNDYFVGNEITKIITCIDGDNIKNGKFTIWCRDLSSGTFECDIIMLEYQEGMENWDIPYFEGMQSVKTPVLTTAGKNLIDYKNYNLKANGQQNPQEIIVDEQGLSFNVDSVGWKSLWYDLYLESGEKYTLSYDTNLLKCFIFKSKVNTYVNSELVASATDIDATEDKIQKVTKTFTAPSTGFIRVRLTSEQKVGNHILQDFQIEKGSTVTSYEPHKTNILTANDDVTLRGIGDVQDTLDCLTGEVTTRIKEVVLNGSENWILYSLSDVYPDVIGGYIKVDGLQVGINKILSDKFKTFNGDLLAGSLRGNDEGITTSSTGIPYIKLSLYKNRLETLDLNGFKKYLSQNPITVQYQLATESIKTVDLSDNHVYSYNDVTHYDCSSAEGSLVPTLSVKVPTDTQLTIQGQKATTQTLLIKNMDLQQSIKEVQAMNLAFNTALYNSFNSIREEVEDIKKHVSTNENLEGSF